MAYRLNSHILGAPLIIGQLYVSHLTHAHRANHFDHTRHSTFALPAGGSCPVVSEVALSTIHRERPEVLLRRRPRLRPDTAKASSRD